MRGHQDVWKDQSLLGGSCSNQLCSKQEKSTHLAYDFARVGVPAQSPVVLTTRKQEIGVLLAPRNGQDTLVVTAQYLVLSALECIEIVC